MYIACMEIDAIDNRILSILQTDGTISNQDLAERVGLSPPLRLSGAAQPNPTQDRQRASNDAQRGKPHDEPDKLRRVRNAENPAPERHCCKPDESEPNGAGAEDIGQQSHLRVLECARAVRFTLIG